ncbi:MAG TPA: ABC transporter ATP-binding protein [Candidatus Acidoferrales bacterium]|nr:ABC transporter ATP-binding protein [Candidatus Acidoferrales bacterium]
MISRSELGRLLSYVRPYSGRMTVAILLLAVVGVTEGLTALMITPAVDRVLNPAVTDPALPLLKLPWGGPTIYLNSFFPSSIRYVWTVFAISLVVIFIGKAISEFFGSLLIQYVGHAAVTDLRNQVYARLIRQPIGFFQHNPTGRLMSAVISNVERVRSALSEWLADFFRQSFTFIAYGLVLLLVDWKMALGALIVFPLALIPLSRLGRRIRRGVEDSQSRLAELSQILQETVSGNRVVKAFGMEDFEIGKFRSTARRLLRENMRWIRAHLLSSPLMEILGALVFAMVLLYARDQIRHGLMTIGTFGTFIFALLRVYEPVKRMGIIYNQFQQALGASAQVFAYLDLPEEQTDAPGARLLSPFSQSIEFDDVCFAYDSGPLILRNINLTARAGEVIAIVGSSGAGKTTLVNLIPRFHAVTSGELCIDGINVNEVSIRSLREQIAIVTQETILFHDTVWNNICYGRPEMDEARVFAAAQAALAHDFVLELPQGYQTVLGERGQRLSGGQRQRLAIARALLKNSPILILDEATSELDSESELLVQRALANLMVGRTVFVIAHRLSTIRRSDKILVLEDGGITESGTHQELLARGGSYSRLYELQFAGADRASLPTGLA